MAYDKVVNSAELDDGLTAVADAIRDKTGETDSLIFPGGFVAAVAGIVTGGSSNSAVDGEIHDITIEADLQTEEQMLLFQNEFVVANYLKTGFMVLLFQTEPSAATTNRLYSVVQGNVNLGSSNDPVYGYFVKDVYGQAASSAIKKNMTAAMNSSTTRFRTDDVGSLFVYAASGNILSAGTYKLVLLSLNI